MPTLPGELRNKLERVVIDARDAAEMGARAALEALAVHHHEPYPHLKKQPELLKLRNHLRARARQLGDRQDASGRLAIDHLAGECAYEHWHRMLFARFLAENSLLIEPDDNMAISLAEAEELAKEEDVDVWVYASRCAQRMLPQIFRPDDPLLQFSFATEHRIKLEMLLASLPAEVFTASDALGWVYQFWQSKKKDEVNRSEVKIGADEISAVTQLFTEPYMVEFLLHNTLGAWWAGRKLSPKDAAAAKTENELRAMLALPGVGWEYLRFVCSADGEGGPWCPAAGTFDGWPKTATELRVLDPCCGSGHFLVAALRHLVPIRMAEEGLSAADAVDVVLRDNLHGLEIDERCCQIAAFALAFAAWTYPDAGGYRPLPELHIACTGIGPQCSADQWIKLAEQSGVPMPTLGRQPIKDGLLNLHRLFSQAPTLGSLINPADLPADLIAADYETIRPYLAAIFEAEKSDDETRERAIAAAGMFKAADLLAGDYTLVVTNVPYLARGKQNDILKDYCVRAHNAAKADLATCLVERCLAFCAAGGATALVTPQNWLFLTTYKKLREQLLKTSAWLALARLGFAAFQIMDWWAFSTCLVVLQNMPPSDVHELNGVDADAKKDVLEKSRLLKVNNLRSVPQRVLLSNPDAVVSLDDIRTASPLSLYADSVQGLASADDNRFARCVWEIPAPKAPVWLGYQGTPDEHMFSGKSRVILWEGGEGALAKSEQARIQGAVAWDRRSIAVKMMRDLRPALFECCAFDMNVSALVPKKEAFRLPIWCFVSSDDYRGSVRRINQKLNVTNATLAKVHFDLAHWQQVAANQYPDGLPAPESDDPTQWLFHGRPEESTAPLQVAAARLLGYRWPAELDENMTLSKRARSLTKLTAELAKYADGDGIVCIPAVRGEEPAAERLGTLLTATGIRPARARELVGGGDLDEWLRNNFFDEHCNLFHDRPFVWHIWDGRKNDGFHALVNYHKLCEGGGKGRRLLESLTYAYLGEWITRQRDGVKRGEGGAEDRLAAAVELQNRLKAIIDGEPPFDIFVRWKPLAEQPIGWEPDINDGVRVNIRPFLASDLPGGRTGAGVLRWKPNIKWVKDRGKEPDRPKAEYPWFWGWDEKTTDFAGGKTFDGNRWNDCHYTNQFKQAARERKAEG